MERRSARRTAGRLATLGGGLGVAATALAARAVAVTTAVASPAARVDDWVELVVVGGAALAAAWVALGALLGLAVVTSARAGVRWKAGEAAVRALTPGLVRRLVRAGVGVGVGAGLVLTPTVAFAADPAPETVALAAEAGSTNTGSTEAGTAGSAADTSVRGGEIDLSWQPTHVDPVAEVESIAKVGPTVEVEAAPPLDPTHRVDPPTPPAPPAQAAQPQHERTSASVPASPHPPAEAATTTEETSAHARPATPSVAAGAKPAEPATPAAATGAATPASHPVASPQAGGTVVVLRGDTLWDIAARSLGGDAPDAEVLAATVRWHAANREVIGDDADVILPGQILTPPA